MYNEAHTFSKHFLGDMQTKQCRDSSFSTGWDPGRPKRGSQLKGWPGLWALAHTALGKERQASNTRLSSVSTCLWNKLASLISHSHSILYPQHDLKQFASPFKVLILRCLEKEMLSVVWSCLWLSQRVRRTSSGRWQSKHPQGVFLTPDYLYFFHDRIVQFSSVFLIHKDPTEQTLELHSLFYPFHNLRLDFLRLRRNSLCSGLQSGFIEHIWIFHVFIYSLGAKRVRY